MDYPRQDILEDDKHIEQKKDKLKLLVWAFDDEFRRVSQEKYAPTKSNKSFKDVAEEWFCSSL